MTNLYKWKENKIGWCTRLIGGLEVLGKCSVLLRLRVKMLGDFKLTTLQTWDKCMSVATSLSMRKFGGQIMCYYIPAGPGSFFFYFFLLIMHSSWRNVSYLSPTKTGLSQTKEIEHCIM